MAGSQSADLRGRVLAAVDAGATPAAAARRFVVGRSTTYRSAGEEADGREPEGVTSSEPNTPGSGVTPRPAPPRGRSP